MRISSGPNTDVHLKTDKVDFKKAIVKKNNSIFLQSTHQVDMKNAVEC